MSADKPTGRSYLLLVVALAVLIGLLIFAGDTWHHATDANSDDRIEQIIEADKRHFESMQDEWDARELAEPGWTRPQPRTEAEYNQWRKSSKPSR